MTTVFNSLVDNAGLSGDPYQAAMEIIAPGITAVLGTVRFVNEKWPDTLERILPFLNLTPDQLTLLTAEIANARAGVPAPLVVNNSVTADGVSIKADATTAASAPSIPAIDDSAVKQLGLTEIGAGIGAALSVLNWIRG